eukprot:800583-Rhodomonas_salina.1
MPKLRGRGGGVNNRCTGVVGTGCTGVVNSGCKREINSVVLGNREGDRGGQGKRPQLPPAGNHCRRTGTSHLTPTYLPPTSHLPPNNSICNRSNVSVTHKVFGSPSAPLPTL